MTIAPLRSFARSPMMNSDRLPASKTVVTPAVEIAVQRADAVALLIGCAAGCAAAPAAQVDVRVDHAGDEELSGAVDHARAGRRLHVCARVLDLRAFDHDRGVGDGRAAGAVDQRDAANGDGGGRLCLR